MKCIETALPGVWLFEPKVYGDARGYFMESYKKAEYEKYTGPVDFIQENESCSQKGVLRGLHYQLEPYAQSKLVRVISGLVFDVVVDIRKGSPTFGRYVAFALSDLNKSQIFIPKGFAHGFYVRSETAIFSYLIDSPYMPEYERGIYYNDPDIGINWQRMKDCPLLVSEKDKNAPFLVRAEINFKYNIR